MQNAASDSQIEAMKERAKPSIFRTAAFYRQSFHFVELNQGIKRMDAKGNGTIN